MINLTMDQKFSKEQEDLEREIKERIGRKDLPNANIIVAGITGTGKSTLINAVFGAELAETGIGKAVTEYMEEYKDEEIPINIWDTVGLELDSEKAKKSIDEIKLIIASKNNLDDMFDRIHAIWYCINSGSNRYQGAELNFIKKLHSTKVPFIIVLTQCTGSEEEVDAFENKIKEINSSEGMNDIEIVQVLAKPQKFKAMIDPIPAFGLEKLVDITLKKLPEFIKSGFIASQRISRDKKREECENIIYDYVFEAQRGFWNKIPLVNFPIIDGDIKNMFRKIGQMYNIRLISESIDKITKESRMDFKNYFLGIISPIDFGYSDKISDLLNRKKIDGFDVKVADVEKSDRIARMMAFYGYTLVESIEEYWGNRTDEELVNIDDIAKELTKIINTLLRKKRAIETK